MLIDGVRIKWGVDRLTRCVTLYFSVNDVCDSLLWPDPLSSLDGVEKIVTQTIDVLVDSNVLSESSRNLVIGLSRELFENWGYRWEACAS